MNSSLFHIFPRLQPHFFPGNTIGRTARGIACNEKEGIVLFKRCCFCSFFDPFLPWLTCLLSSTDTLQFFDFCMAANVARKAIRFQTLYNVRKLFEIYCVHFLVCYMKAGNMVEYLLRYSLQFQIC